MPDRARITVMGGATVDRLAFAGSAIVPGASNPGHAVTRAGGVGFGLATILARLGDSVRFVGRTGDDTDGAQIETEARAAGVDTHDLSVAPGQRTCTYTGVFDRRGDLVVGVADFELYDSFLPHVVPSAVANFPAEGDTLCVVDANLPEPMLRHVCRAARARDVLLAGLTVSPAKSVRLAASVRDLDWLIANRAEAGALLGLEGDDRPPAAELATALAALSHGNALVTDGGEALAVAAGDAVEVYRPRRVEVVGVNGAGDSLAAGLLHGIANGVALRDAVRLGMAAAALTLTHGGIAAAGFSRERLDAEVARQQGNS